MVRGMWIKLVLAAGAAVLLTTGSASAAQFVGPNQQFSGVVNGSVSNATVFVVCPGPVQPGQVGRPFNDSWQVVTGTGGGFTGSAANHIVASIVVPVSASDTSTFTEYGVPQNFPSTLLLPCSGTGLAVFAPEPTSGTARRSTVTVRFVNIAV